MRKILTALLFLVMTSLASAQEGDLDAIRAKGELRHLGVPYANFVTGAGDGLSVELMQLFAAELGVSYRYVKTDWPDVIGDLTGQRWVPDGDGVVSLGEVPIRGDVISNGLTVIPWREQILDFSQPTFPTQVWLISRPGTGLLPIAPAGNLEEDIAAVKQQLFERSLLGKANTCLDPSLYNLSASGARPKLFAGNLNDLAPAVLAQEADSAILDVPDSLVALEKWAGEVTVIGPISEEQVMAEGFRKDSPRLRDAYNRFIDKLRADGSLANLVRKYYPAVFEYYPDFFTTKRQQ